MILSLEFKPLRHLLLVAVVFFPFTAFAQYFMIIDHPEGKSGAYFMQMSNVKWSLENNGQRHRQLNFSKNYSLSDEKLKTLSGKFKQALPVDFYENEGALAIGPISLHPDTKEFLWTYAVQKNAIIKYIVQFIVTFEGSDNDPKITKIDVKVGNEIPSFDSKKIAKLYKERQEEYKRNPPPAFPGKN